MRNHQFVDCLHNLNWKSQYANKHTAFTNKNTINSIIRLYVSMIIIIINVRIIMAQKTSVSRLYIDTSYTLQRRPIIWKMYVKTKLAMHIILDTGVCNLSFKNTHTHTRTHNLSFLHMAGKITNQHIFLIEKTIIPREIMSFVELYIVFCKWTSFAL